MVLERNESVQQKLLEFEATRRRQKAELGVFEPALVSSASREANNRQNTVEQQRSTLSDTFNERNNIYDEGLESLVPSGARIRLGYNLRDLRNNLQNQASFASLGATNGEYQSFLGLSISQPLLKNAWFPATRAGIRIAALSSKGAFQEYRRQLMNIMSITEASYWNLYLAQEQVRFYQESVKTAARVLTDSKTRFEAGKGSSLEELEAEAGLALRRSKLSEAQQKLNEAVSRLTSLYAWSTSSGEPPIEAVDAPEIGPEMLPASRFAQAALELNPDYLAQRQKLDQERIRLGYARNQRLPELNLKGSYGLNGLGDSAGSSWTDTRSADWPSWTIGIELRIPLGGDIKARNLLSAAKLEVKSGELALHDLQIQIVNGLDTAWHKIRSSREGVESYRTSVKFNQSLLDAALIQFLAGKVDCRKVLEIEADLLEAKASMVEALVQYRRSVLEFELVEGGLLKRRGLDLTQQNLANATQYFVQASNPGSKSGYQDSMRYLINAYRINQVFNRLPTPLPYAQGLPNE